MNTSLPISSAYSSSFNPYTEGFKIFNEVIEATPWRRTKSPEQALEFLQRLLKATDGILIVDFLDAACFDYLTWVDFDDKSGILQLCWRHNHQRDLRALTLEDEGRFHSSTYSCLIQFRELSIERSGKCPIVTIGGYTLHKGTINDLLSVQGKKVELYDRLDNFTAHALRMRGDAWEKFMVMDTPIFCLNILPKGRLMAANDSTEWLLQYNIGRALERMLAIQDQIKSPHFDLEELDQKMNNVRSLLESVLKIELCYRST